mmetsp:Transcript_14628/g.22722  ORF Transcript_14628/g.22722 Transcript_14628/m.22722 type:complete len:182 (-) Transcript_14628:244-789(-)|eukprot:CAMPEP_0184296366 /NCGR_PEP_ID=MMETSP1049-20130417/7352_1 /TAXON_ID=77928 /ORGANISM="Proteomonas sulcata, Strain CCMP704" /LENGTH=181 /DNA_ID=CAMNT_0026605569 /DNA_START=586 /DNA_END=1131 /DNA_ORIENTATION=+
MTFEGNSGPWEIRKSVIRAPGGKCLVVGGEASLKVSDSKVEGIRPELVPRVGIQVWDNAKVELNKVELRLLNNGLNIYDAGSLTANSAKFHGSLVYHCSMRDESIGIFVDCKFLREGDEEQGVTSHHGIIWASSENAVTLELKQCEFPTNNADELWSGSPKPHVMLCEDCVFLGAREGLRG